MKEMTDAERNKAINEALNGTLFDRKEKKVSNALGLDQNISSTTRKKLRRIKQKYFGMKVFNSDEKRFRLKNSDDFDRASYAADGGDSWINPGRALFFQDPVGVDEGLWEHCQQRSLELFGSVRWQFAAWLYSKLGGKYT